MKTNQMMVMGLVAVCAMAFAGEASARGGNGGGSGMNMRTQSQTQMQTKTQTQTKTRTQSKTRTQDQTKVQDPTMESVVKPADSQRRDGTFLTTGTTANGSTVRPSNGKGLQDGSGLAIPTTDVAPQ
ncbi:MAG: hypothetical protein PHP95_09860 [Desulfuromonadaceae bacterium]|nr:hypothetical protein [Desulfuromonadaceae bacterium]MDD2848748.1 hypothetical protein [Desulfuromonadaceae bacterium]MDD4130398.1 hypothetical protein [Desulfuromonadaceae bacterium]